MYDPEGKPSAGLRNAVTTEAFKRGLILLGCGETSLRCAPPLCITEAELTKGIEIFEQAVSAIEAKRNHDN